jgi:hypothetical protein
MKSNFRTNLAGASRDAEKSLLAGHKSAGKTGFSPAICDNVVKSNAGLEIRFLFRLQPSLPPSERQLLAN